MDYTKRKDDRVEVWKDIKGYEGFYKSSTFGRARSLDTYRKDKNGTVKFYRGRILKPITDKNGYLYVNLYKNNKLKRFLIHRLIAEAFLEIPEELKHLKGTRYLQVNHKDECKTNNNAENLEWCSSSYNVNYGTGIERRSKTQSKPVLQYDLEGNFIKEWKSVTECGRNGFSYGAVAACCRGELKKYKDFIWKYK